MDFFCSKMSSENEEKILFRNFHEGVSDKRENLRYKLAEVNEKIDEIDKKLAMIERDLQEKV